MANKSTTFYLIAKDSPQDSIDGKIDYVCYLASHFAKLGAKVYINANNKEEAEQIDEQFWQQEPDSFQAHNLSGEGPDYGSAIEIGHDKLKPLRNRQLVINMADNDTIFALNINQVVDFVPCDEIAKQQARHRYAMYRQSGFDMQTLPLQYENTNDDTIEPKETKMKTEAKVNTEVTE